MLGFFESKPKFDVNKCKVQLKCLVTRLDQRAAKKGNIAKQEKKKVAMLLKDDREHNARIQVEQIIRDDYVLESYELIKQYAEMLTARINVLQLEPELKPEIADSVCALVYAGYCMGGEIEELKQLFRLFTAKYGKQFTESVVNEKEKYLNDRFLKILVSTSTPDKTVVEAYLVEIAKIYDVEYKPQEGGAQPLSTTLGIALPTPGMPMPGSQVPGPVPGPMVVPGPSLPKGGEPIAPPAMPDMTDLSGVAGPAGPAAVPVARAVTTNGTPIGQELPMGFEAPASAYSLALAKATTASKEGGLLRTGFGLLVDYNTNCVVEVDFSATPGLSTELLRSAAVGDRVVAFDGRPLDENTTIKSLAVDVDIGATAVFQLLRGGGAPVPAAPPPMAQPTVIGGPPPPAAGVGEGVPEGDADDILARRLAALRGPNV